MSEQLEWKEELNTERMRKAYNFINWLMFEMQDGKVELMKLPTSIVFVKMAEKGDIDEVTAREHKELFLPWTENVNYSINDIRAYFTEGGSKLYKCLQAHTSQADWTPDVTPSLWKEIGISPSGIPEWSQPIGAGDAYMTGDEVMYNGVHYRSTIDNNVWSPDMYPQGWEVVA